MKSVKKSRGLFILVIFIGGILGNFLGDFISNNIKSLDVLKIVYNIGLTNPIHLNLKIVEITFGMNFNFNIMSIVGVILAIILYRRY
ncbi:DUF4321 domain-containing protein [Clostridium algidicarnis]|uniref:DUF4321 domain-containing protein n=1 Tax=Clostridium algidicarnis TaxID=37659 RepID=UPI001C0B428D|nr:DUF4321 domain-containing protein [Clostridium algidicarnis]MBU3228975.1 DUF4321 domain-containing protein [Clostridium algidicarnis]MBU3252519.1 DUF4321 domain-containing protein [Clostridium algidicarnis]